MSSSTSHTTTAVTIQNILNFCYALSPSSTTDNNNNNSNNEDPLFDWKDTLSKLAPTSQIINTLVQELNATNNLANNNNMKNSTTTTNDNKNYNEGGGGEGDFQQQEARVKQVRIIRRAIVIKTIFRSLLQPIVSNLLVNAFRSNAMRLFVNHHNPSNNNNNNNDDDDDDTSSIKLVEHCRSNLETLSKTTLPALTAISAIKTKNSLVKLIHLVSSSSSSSSFSFEKSILFEFMKSAGFELVSSASTTNTNNQTSSSSSSSYLDDGVQWQWQGVVHLQKLVSELTSSSSTSRIATLFHQVRSSLQSLKWTETNILSPLEKMINTSSSSAGGGGGIGGLLSVDRIVTLDFKLIMNKDDKSLKNFISNALEKENSSTDAANNKNNNDDTSSSFDVVSQVLSQKNEARKKAQQQQDEQRFAEAKLRAEKEVEAHHRAIAAEAERKKKEEDLHKERIASVQHLLPVAKKTLHETGRMRNATFEGVIWSIQPLSVATRIHLCSANKEGCDQQKGLEVHWHLRAAPNVLYAFTAHLTPDATRMIHVGEEIGYQYNTVPGMHHFGKTTMVNRKLVDGLTGKLEKIEANLSKEVTTCVCGETFDVLWK